jgi:hydrogenase expression/formation protein HypE
MATSRSSHGSFDRIVLAHGGGGELMTRLIREHLLPALTNARLAPLSDSAVLPWLAGDLVFTTDSYVVTPLEFPGGDIGRLAVCGTVNDLAVMGAEPVALSLGLILEEGLPLALLDRIVASIAAAAREAGVDVVTGDTKVIERRRSPDRAAPAAPAAPGLGQDPERERRGATPAPDSQISPTAPTSAADAPGLFINTAGVGRLRQDVNLDLRRVTPDDAVLINGTLADHGLTIMSVRNGIEFESELRTDAAPLNGLIAALLDTGADVKFLRDPTRGGLAGVLADICETTGLSVEVEEARLPISPTARHAAEMLGLDPITVANEGKVVCVVAPRDADRALTALRAHPLGRHAARIGRVSATQPPLVELLTRAGGRRIVQRPYGEELPRIC